MAAIDSVKFYVLNAMADDWESISQIEPQVLRYHGDVSRDSIFMVLRQLHDAGYVQAMDEDGYGLKTFPANPLTAWFSMTDSGRVLFEENFPYYGDD